MLSQRNKCRCREVALFIDKSTDTLMVSRFLDDLMRSRGQAQTAGVPRPGKIDTSEIGRQEPSEARGAAHG